MVCQARLLLADGRSSDVGDGDFYPEIHARNLAELSGRAKLPRNPSSRCLLFHTAARAFRTPEDVQNFRPAPMTTNSWSATASAVSLWAVSARRSRRTELRPSAIGTTGTCSSARADEALGRSSSSENGSYSERFQPLGREAAGRDRRHGSLRGYAAEGHGRIANVTADVERARIAGKVPTAADGMQLRAGITRS